MAARAGPLVKVLEENGTRGHVVTDLQGFDSMMTHMADPRRTPEILALRERMRRWRFYDHFRTDQEAPARRPQVGTRTPVLASDGADLAAAMQTLREIGDEAALDEAIEDAFPGSRIVVTIQGGLFEVLMHQQGLLRPLRAAELSDGTLRYLLLVTALLTPRPPSLMVLNEPETSLHPSLLEPLARLIAKAAGQAQLVVVSHARPLVDALAKDDRSAVFELKKELGETVIDDLASPAWSWPRR
jgi:predicted ATPase